MTHYGGYDARMQIASNYQQYWSSIWFMKRNSGEKEINRKMIRVVWGENVWEWEKGERVGRRLSFTYAQLSSLNEYMHTLFGVCVCCDEHIYSHSKQALHELMFH